MPKLLELFILRTLNACFRFQKYCNQQENIEKPTVASFRLMTRNLKLLFYFVPCRLFVHLVRVQRRLSFSTQTVR